MRALRDESSTLLPLFLILKAKLVAVDAGISTIEREFLSDIMLPDGTLIGEWLQPQLAASYEQGGMPALLPGLDEAARPRLVR